MSSGIINAGPWKLVMNTEASSSHNPQIISQGDRPSWPFAVRDGTPYLRYALTITGFHPLPSSRGGGGGERPQVSQGRLRLNYSVS